MNTTANSVRIEKDLTSRTPRFTISVDSTGELLQSEVCLSHALMWCELNLSIRTPIELRYYPGWEGEFNLSKQCYPFIKALQISVPRTYWDNGTEPDNQTTSEVDLLNLAKSVCDSSL